MRIFTLFICCLFSFVSVSQDTGTEKADVKKRKINRHQLELSPASVWLNSGFSLGHRLKYQLQLKRSMRIELETNGTLIRRLDRNANELRKDKVLPLLNQTTAVYSMNLIGKGKTINRNKQKRFISSLRLGYHFFQHATRYSNYEFWAYDSTQQSGYNSIRSFQSHSISAGLGFHAQKYKRKDGVMTQVASHKWSLDYLGSVHYQLTAYSINDAKDYDVRTIPNPYELRKSGARFNYNYTRYLNSYFGIHVGMEALVVPFLKDYQYQPQYFVPRGGKLIYLLHTNVHVGVSFVF